MSFKAPKGVVFVEGSLDPVEWEYRVVLCEGMYLIFEVYYDENGEICGWAGEPIPPCGDTIEELGEDLAIMQRALELPVINYQELEEKLEGDSEKELLN